MLMSAFGGKPDLVKEGYESLLVDPLRITEVPRSVALIDISIWGVFMDRRCILGLFATASILVPAIPDIAIGQGKSLKDQLVGTWIYVSSTGKRDDGSAVDRPPAQGALHDIEVWQEKRQVFTLRHADKN